MTLSAMSLIEDLEDAVTGKSQERRVEMLRRVTDYFMSASPNLNGQHTAAFDGVFLHLTEFVEEQALAHLSGTLCDVSNAPVQTVRKLAFHQDAAVASPLLEKSSVLTEDDLAHVASTRGQQHLTAISKRAMLGERLTDILIKRGDSGVFHTLAVNNGARFSNDGYRSLVESAESDGVLAEKIGTRQDVPEHLMTQLVLKATDAVRAKLLRDATPENSDKIQAALRLAGQALGVKIKAPVNYADAQSAVAALNRAGNLSDAAVGMFAKERDFPKVAASIALRAAVPIESINLLLESPTTEGTIVACRAADLSAATACLILENRPNVPQLSKADLRQATTVFNSLSLFAAQKTMRFWSVRNKAQSA